MKKALFISLCALLLMSIGCKKGSVTPTPQIISVTSITLSAQSLTLEVGGSEQLTATVLPANADNKAVSWSSSNQAVATVADGLVTAVKKGSATITVKTADGGKTATCAVTVENPKVVAIDLGLSVKWADRNIGAETPEEYGDYFAWGETSPKEIYPWDNYKFWDGTNVTKYTASDHLFVMDEVDDVAHKVLGGKWRMPTAGEWEELRNEMNWQTVQNGVKGKATGTNSSCPLPACTPATVAPAYIWKGKKVFTGHPPFVKTPHPVPILPCTRAGWPFIPKAVVTDLLSAQYQNNIKIIILCVKSFSF